MKDLPNPLIRKAFLALCLVSVAAGCGVSSGRGKNTSVPDRYFVQGDPMVMLDGTVGDKESFLTIDGLSAFDNYTLAGFTVFAQKVDTTAIERIDSQEELEEQNSTSDNEFDSELSLYEFQKDADKYFYRAPGDAFVDYPVLDFIAINDRLAVTALNGYAVTAEHYSLSADQRVFSILVSGTDELGNFLAAVTFTRVDGQQKALPKLDNSYQYIGGTGVAIGWHESVKISVCGELTETEKAIFTRSVTDWSTATGDAIGTLGGLRYEVDVVPTSKPWSDVNQHCINLVKSYRWETQEDTAVLGVTLPVVDVQNFTLVDSQIFIFYDALARLRQSTLVTATHEMGHFWGLGHEFSRDSRGRTLHPSIMGYEGVSSITSWDEAAILALYPP